jgi:O-antigen ligase
VAAAAALAVAAVSLFALTPLLARFDRAGSDLNRGQFWPVVIDAARSFAPLGAGIGSFDRVFAAVEPLTMVGPRYLNHAHNDFLETWLEAGWPGLAAVGAFLLWLILANLRAWRSPSALARAAGASVALLLAFSFPDYPLRTEALAVFLAFCCGIMAAPPKAQA